MRVARATGYAGKALPWLVCIYGAASLLHFAHNAEYLGQYPNLPISWTRGDVYGAWCCITGIGTLGFCLYRWRHHRTGLSLLALYAVLGFAGLLHYGRAPFSHHTVAMNLTIWIEVVAAMLLLIDVACLGTQDMPPQ